MFLFPATVLILTMFPTSGFASPIPSARGVVVFLGAWQDQGMKTTLVSNTAGILNSPYMDALQNAGYGVGRGQVDFQQTLRGSELPPGSTITDDQVAATLRQAIGTQLPANDPTRLYVVFLPPNVIFTANAQGQSYSSASNMTGWNNEFDLGNLLVHYVVVPFPGGKNVSANGRGDHDSLTESLSHEIGESVTETQNGDHTERFHVRMSNGIAVQEFGQLSNPNLPIPIPGATPLPF
jgi:hypothetical protein